MKRALCLALLLSLAGSVGAQTADRATEELRAEMVFWESVRSSSDPADFRAYLEQYPKGKFAALARNRLSALNPQPAIPAPAASPAASAKENAARGAGPGGLTVGDTWTYRLVEPRRTDGPPQREYRVKLASVSADGIVEQYSVGQGTASEWTHGRGSYLVALGPALFSPYMSAFGNLPTVGSLGRVQVADGVCNGQYICQASARVVATETITVPAGTFKAIRVLVEHNWRGAQAGGHPAQAALFNGARRMTVWYAPEVKRAVKYSSRLDFGAAPPIDTDFDLELVSYQLQ
jgi:hypothetical protein